MIRGETLGVVAGSGLDLLPLLDVIDEERDFREVLGLTTAGVSGHSGRFVFGRSEGVSVVLQCGRLHLYEGLGYAHATVPVAALSAFGVNQVVFTNAAGGLLPDMQPGDLMAADAIRAWPYSKWDAHARPITPDFVPADCEWRGAYHWVHGPCYETRAEIAALRSLGSAAVGMSIAPEMARAQALGMRVAAISCITNNCCTPQVLTHDHVLRTAAAASTRLCAVVRGLMRSTDLNTESQRPQKVPSDVFKFHI